MKACLFILMIALVCALNTGCCKQACNGQQLFFHFVGYKNTDIDTILITHYKGGTSFTEKIDSIYRGIQQPQADTLLFFLADNVVLTDDYILSSPAFSRPYKLSNITTETISCPCGGRSTKAVNTLAVDGVQVESENIYLVK